MRSICNFLGGVGSQGTVQEVGDLNNSWRSALDIQWDNGGSNRYRLGFDGRVDVHAVVESSAGFIYAEHLPKLCKMLHSFFTAFVRNDLIAPTRALIFFSHYILLES